MPDIVAQENTLNPTDLPCRETSNGVFTLTVICTLQKMLISYLDFCLVSSQDIQKFLNREGFSRQVKIIVLFSEKNKSKLSEFLLETSKIICQWGKQNNLISNRKQDYFVYPIGRLFCLFQAKTLNFDLFFRKTRQ